MGWLFDSVRSRMPAQPPAPSPSAAGSPVVFDEELLARLRRLTLLSNRAISQGLAGEHRSQRRGSSPEFADFKSYSQGDDFRRIDWNIYSRLGELFVRLSEVTTELTVHLLLDASGSMAWSGDPARVDKFTYARRVAGALGYVGLWHFDRVAVTPFRDQLGVPFGPAHGRSHITPLLTYLTGLDATGQTSVAEAIERYVRARRRPGILIVVSDLLSGEADDVRSALQVVRSRGWQATVIQIIDPAEADPAGIFPAAAGGAGATVELLDLEQASRLRVTPTEAALAAYRRAYRSWQDEVDAMMASERIPLIALQTDWPFDSVVLGLLARQEVLG